MYLLCQPLGWPDARSDVLFYIPNFISFELIKVNHRPPQGKIMPLLIPDGPGSAMGVDFIVKLPL